MFCEECGKKLVEGAAFCSYCGAKVSSLISSETVESETSKAEPIQKDIESVPTILQEADKSTQNEKIFGWMGSAFCILILEGYIAGVIIESPVLVIASLIFGLILLAVMALLTKKSTHKSSKDTYSNQGYDTAAEHDGVLKNVYKLLSEGSSSCKMIKKIDLIDSKMIKIKGEMFQYIIKIVSGQAKVASAPISPLFMFLYIIPALLISNVVCGISWDLTEQGSFYFDNYALAFAFGLITSGIAVAIYPFIGHKEKDVVSTYVREIVEPEGFALISNQVRKKSFTGLIIPIVLILNGIIVLIAYGIGDLDLGGNAKEPAEVVDQTSLNETESVSTQKEDDETDLSQTYTNEEEGFSFIYPNDWTVDKRYDDALISISSASVANVTVVKDYVVEEFFYDSLSDFKEFFPTYIEEASGVWNADDIKVVSLDDILLSGHFARKLTVTYNSDDIYMNQVLYFYRIDMVMYVISCTTPESLLDKYEPVFDSIMDSYTITVPFRTPSQNGTVSISNETNRVDGAYYIGDTVSMSQPSSSGKAGYDITMTDWGTYVPGYASNEIYVYVTFEVVNTGDEDIFISAYDFNAYVNNYSVGGGIIPLGDNGLSATLSPGRRTSGNVYIQMSPYDVNNLELELGNIIFRIQDDTSYGEFAELSDFSYNNLYLYGGSYVSGNNITMGVGIYSSFDEGTTVGNIFVQDSLGHEFFATIRDDKEGEGVYTLCSDDSKILKIKFYEDFSGGLYADIQGLDMIFTDANQVETFIMTEQYIP